MHTFFIEYAQKGDKKTTKHKVQAPDAPAALKSLGWPNTQVFAILQYMTYDEIELMLQNNPVGELMRFEEWEAKFGPANSHDFLWIKPTESSLHGPWHRTLNGGRVRFCALTGHARYTSIAEHYKHWIEPGREGYK